MSAAETQAPRSSLAKDFHDFLMRGNVVDLAVAVVVGAAFTAIVNSLADDMIMPPIGLLLGRVDFSNLFILLKEGTKAGGPYTTLAEAKAAGAVTLNYGLFLSRIFTFFIVATSVFALVRALSGFRRQKAPPPPPALKQCPFCLSSIPVGAKKCAHCTADLAA
ncbi:MAG TPA: large conductance mechanosensitive channel protein MscL [Gemmatimonadales bacterium]|nr:large conductance mechanosensitive channel protein MscL [Gemmatimonadales bacterium]